VIRFLVPLHQILFGKGVRLCPIYLDDICRNDAGNFGARFEWKTKNEAFDESCAREAGIGAKRISAIARAALRRIASHALSGPVSAVENSCVAMDDLKLNLTNEERCKLTKTAAAKHFFRASNVAAE